MVRALPPGDVQAERLDEPADVSDGARLLQCLELAVLRFVKGNATAHGMAEQLDVTALELVSGRGSPPGEHVFGELDHQVPAESNRDALLAILSSRQSHRFTVEVWPQANHVFQLAKTGGREEYESLELQFAPGLLEFIGGWLRSIR